MNVCFLIMPVVINSVTPLVNYGSAVATYAARYGSQIAFVQAHPVLFAKLAAYPSPAAIPPNVLAQAVAAAGGGATGTRILTTIGANGPAINGVIAVAPKLAPLAPVAGPGRRTSTRRHGRGRTGETGSGRGRRRIVISGIQAAGAPPHD